MVLNLSCPAVSLHRTSVSQSVIKDRIIPRMQFTLKQPITSEQLRIMGAVVLELNSPDLKFDFLSVEFDRSDFEVDS